MWEYWKSLESLGLSFAWLVTGTNVAANLLVEFTFKSGRHLPKQPPAFRSSLFSTRLTQHSSECGVLLVFLLGLVVGGDCAHRLRSMSVNFKCMYACCPAMLPAHSQSSIPKTTTFNTSYTPMKTPSCSNHTSYLTDFTTKGLEQFSVPNPTTLHRLLPFITEFSWTHTLSCRLV